MVVFGLLMSNHVQAQDLKFATLFQGQGASFTFTQSTPFGINSVFVTSIGNSTMSASIPRDPSPSDASGWWLVTLWGTGGRTFFDAGFGLLPWSAGQDAVIDIGPISFCFASATIFVSNLGATDADVLSFTFDVGP
jgi:hypothetical protein